MGRVWHTDLKVNRENVKSACAGIVGGTMKKIPEGKRLRFMESVKSSNEIAVISWPPHNDSRSHTFLILLADKFHQLPPCPLLADWCRRQKSMG